MRRLRVATGETFRSFQVRNFRLFFTGQAVSQVGSWMRQVALTLLVLDLTDSGVAVGVLTACQFLPVLVLGAWAGVVADRADKRRVLFVAQSLLMAVSFVIAALAFSGDPPVVALYAVALAGGICTAFENPARRAFVVEMVPETHVQNAVSLNSAVMTGSRIIGPTVAGILVTTVGYGWCFVVDGLSYLAVLAGLWRIDAKALRSSPLAVRARGQVREGLRYVRRVPELKLSLFMMAIVGTLTFNFGVVFPLFATRSLDGSTTDFTVLFSVVSAGAFVGALRAARRVDVNVRHLVRGCAVFGVAIACLALMPTVPTALPVAFVVGASSMAYMTASTSLLQLHADPTMRARVLALQAIVFFGSTPVGGPILGFVSEQFGARAGLGVGAAACFAAATWGMWAGRDVMSRTVRPGGSVVDTTDVAHAA